MSHLCTSCGNDVFIGELRCPSCKAEIPHAAEDARAAGVDLDDSGHPTPPRPEGLGLIVGKISADQEAHRQSVERESAGSYGGVGYGSEPSFDETYDAVADLVKPQRDRQGNVIWDPKSALIGGVVVAVFVAIVVYLVLGSLGK